MVSICSKFVVQSLYTSTFILAFMLLLNSNSLYGQRLSPFLSKTLNSSELKGEPIPFERTISYFDYLNDSTPYDTVISGNPAWYIYIFLPADVSELGIRIISPVPELFFANRGDIETDEFIQHSTNRNINWFDSALHLESLKKDQSNKLIVEKILGSNSTSREVPALPSGKYGNPLLSLSSQTVKTGYYRIALINENSETHKSGSFVIQIGTVPAIKSIQISRNLIEL